MNPGTNAKWKSKGWLSLVAPSESSGFNLAFSLFGVHPLSFFCVLAFLCFSLLAFFKVHSLSSVVLLVVVVVGCQLLPQVEPI